MVNKIYFVWFATGWAAAMDVAKRAMVRYKSPQKRRATRTILTIDQVSFNRCYLQQIVKNRYVIKENVYSYVTFD